MTIATDPLAETRHALARHWDMIQDAALEHVARAAIVAYGGQLIEPRPGWGPVECELTLLGIQGTGPDPATAARAWAKRARRVGEEGQAA